MSGEKIVRLIRTEGKTRVFEMDDGSVVERTQGTAAWRHNNPGNLKLDYKGSADPYSRAQRTKEDALAYACTHYDGVVDLDQWGNVIFETYEAGRAAQIKLLTTGKYRKETVEEMLNGYSTADYSGPTHHANQLAAIYRTADQQSIDLRNKTIESMTPAELAALADGIAHFEGWQVGGIREIQAATRDSLAHQQTSPLSQHPAPDASTSHVTLEHDAARPETTRTIQQNLNQLGIADAQGQSLAADNHYGPRTRHAIETFQRQHGLQVTGLANQETLIATQMAVSMLQARRDAELFTGMQLDTARSVPVSVTVPTPQRSSAAAQAAQSYAPSIAARTSQALTLQLGDVSPTVNALQEKLNQLGYTDERGHPLQADHHFGPRTHAAVQAFQRDHGLDVDGKVGPRTFAALEQKNHRIQLQTQSHAQSQEAAVPSVPTISTPGMDAASIRTLQRHLNTLGVTDMNQEAVAVTGIYDFSTHAAVGRFQAEQGMPVTGHADEATRTVLQSRAFIADLQRNPDIDLSGAAQTDAPLVRDGPTPTQAAPAVSRATRTPVREDALAPARDMEPRTRAMPAAEPTAIRSANDPRKRHAAHYAELKQRFPQLSEEHLAAATAAIHAAHIPPNKPLHEINLLSNGTLWILTDSPAHMTVRLDTTAPSPSIEQSITHVQTYDTRQAEMAQNYQAQMAHGHHGPTR